MKNCIFVFLFIALQTLSNAEPPNKEKEVLLKWFRQAAYCVAYELGDTPQKISPTPPTEGFERLQKSRILVSRTHLNLVGLTTRTVRQTLLSKEQMAGLTKATFESKVHYPVMDCYQPHHVFIFYDSLGIPLSCIEVCFTCNTIKYAHDLNAPPLPAKLDKSNQEPDPFDNGKDQYEDWLPFRASGDFLAIAKICAQSGMSLGEFKTVEEFQKSRQPTK